MALIDQILRDEHSVLHPSMATCTTTSRSHGVIAEFGNYATNDLLAILFIDDGIAPGKPLPANMSATTGAVEGPIGDIAIA